MTATTILSVLTQNDECECVSDRTRFLTKASADLNDYLTETLDEHQREIFYNADDISLELYSSVFEDGLLSGMTLMRGITEILQSPEKIFKEMVRGYPPIEIINKEALQMRDKYLAQKRRSNQSENTK